MKRLGINCKPLDDLLNGGIESKSITEVYGEAGSGKTNLCLQLSRECAKNGKKVAYIDSEGVSLERLNQILRGLDQKDILSKILFFQPTSLSDQEEIIRKVIKIRDVEFIILDTFNLFYRLILEDDEKPSFRSLNRQITDLQGKKTTLEAELESLSATTQHKEGEYNQLQGSSKSDLENMDQKIKEAEMRLQQIKEDNKLISEISLILTKKLGLKGINGFDFVLKNHYPYLMEINPRIPGSIRASENITISNNSFSENTDGIIIESSSSCTIENNILTQNYFRGIFLERANDNEIVNNTLFDNNLFIYGDFQGSDLSGEVDYLGLVKADEWSQDGERRGILYGLEVVHGLARHLTETLSGDEATDAVRSGDHGGYPNHGAPVQ